MSHATTDPPAAPGGIVPLRLFLLLWLAGCVFVAAAVTVALEPESSYRLPGLVLGSGGAGVIALVLVWLGVDQPDGEDEAC